MTKLEKVFKYFISCFTYILPRNRRICVVGSWFGERYSDNSRYLFEFLTINKEKYGIDQVVWATRSKVVEREVISRGFKVVKINSLLSYYYHLRAKYFFYDQSASDIDYALTLGGIRVNLWHGIPLKKVGHYRKDTIGKPDSKIKSFIRSKVDLNEFILSPSDFISDVMKEAFQKDVILGPYPRNLYLNGEIESDLSNEERFWLNKISESGLKTIFYLPTFRDKAEFKFFGMKDLAEMNETVEHINKLGFTLATKLHFAEGSDSSSILPDGVINIPGHVDVYPILKKVDILITDYSSIYFDFLHLDREIIFYPYDLEYYRDEDRGLLFDYDSFTPGVKVNNRHELLSALDNIRSNKINYREGRMKLKTKIFSEIDLELFISSVFHER
ncbi:CDP-glycerol glycerophosphotransferase family protein [Vibrio breoganii]